MRRCLLNASLGALGTRTVPSNASRELFESRAVAIGAHFGKIEIIQKSVGGNLSWRTVGIRADEEVGESAGDRCVLEDFVDDSSWRDPWRDKDGGHADAEPVEVERVGRAGGVGLRDEAVRRAGGRRNVIVDAAVLVVDDEDRGVRPEVRVLADCVVDRGDELFSGADVVVGMLIGLAMSSPVPSGASWSV